MGITIDEKSGKESAVAFRKKVIDDIVEAFKTPQTTRPGADSEKAAKTVRIDRRN
jgi:hypothetical protein